MLEITRVESIDAKPSEFHEVHEYILSVAGSIDRAIVRLFDEGTNIRINIYYYLTDGSILVYWSERYCPWAVKFDTHRSKSIDKAFEDVKEMVEDIIENEQS